MAKSWTLPQGNQECFNTLKWASLFFPSTISTELTACTEDYLYIIRVEKQSKPQPQPIFVSILSTCFLLWQPANFKKCHLPVETGITGAVDEGHGQEKIKK